MTLPEYEAYVGPQNKRYHEVAEMLMLSKEGVLPLEDEEAEKGVHDKRPKDVEREAGKDFHRRG